eukprot:6200713-Pleurochrysis_carterae.AAC.1
MVGGDATKACEGRGCASAIATRKVGAESAGYSWLERGTGGGGMQASRARSSPRRSPASSLSGLKKLLRHGSKQKGACCKHQRHARGIADWPVTRRQRKRTHTHKQFQLRLGRRAERGAGIGRLPRAAESVRLGCVGFVFAKAPVGCTRDGRRVAAAGQFHHMLAAAAHDDDGDIHAREAVFGTLLEAGAEAADHIDAADGSSDARVLGRRAKGCADGRARVAHDDDGSDHGYCNRGGIGLGEREQRRAQARRRWHSSPRARRRRFHKTVDVRTARPGRLAAPHGDRIAAADANREKVVEASANAGAAVGAAAAGAAAAGAAAVG